MKPSPACIDLIKQFEGCRLQAYEDASRAKIPTIGYGHTGGVKPGDTITEEQAETLLAQDLAGFALYVNEAVRVPISQGQFDALVSFAFNCRGWRDSTLIRKMNALDFDGAAAEFPKWVHADGKELRGLVLRRAAERGLFAG